jgi:hypothetical protein
MLCTVRIKIEGLVGDNLAEPESFDIEGEMVHESKAGPPTRQHGLVECLAGQSVQDPDNVSALIFEAVEQRFRSRSIADPRACGMDGGKRIPVRSCEGHREALTA